MTRVCLITTTINVPTVLQTHVDHVPDDVDLTLIVAGDVQTSPEAERLVEKFDGVYLGVTGENVERWRSNHTIGVRSIQRRNLALLHALTLGPDVVITIDDDNEPIDPATYVPTFVNRLLNVDGVPYFDPRYVTRSSTGWYNPGHVLEPPVVHRGYPLDQRHNRGMYATMTPHPTMAGGPLPGRVGVVAGLWFGDPDVDAIERIVNRPNVYGFRSGSGRREVTLDVGTWAPFNTQNTAYAWDVAPLMQCLVGVGRYDDVWMSYVARVVMDDLGWHVHYGEPLVRQERNQHDLLRDLEDELHGYRHTTGFVERLRALVPLNCSDPLDGLARVYAAINDVVPERTAEANERWLRDVDEAVTEGGQRRRERTSE